MDGHEIANHTWHHFDLTALTAEEITEEITVTETALTEITGKTTFLLRPPYGYTNDTVINSANRPIIRWSVDTYDWAIKSSDNLTSRLVNQTKDGDIILMHDTVATTPKGVEKAIEPLKEKGFTFVTVSQLFAAKGVEPKNNVIYTNVPGEIVNPGVITESNPYAFNESKLASHWAYDDITLMKKLGYMVGDENNHFLPEYPMTRAMFVAVVYRMSGEKYQGSLTSFRDVEAGSWYETAAAWANQNGICKGVGDNCFAPHEMVTREQVCTMLNRYAAYNITDTENTELSFADAHLIGDWAKESVAALTAKNIIHGRPSRLGIAFDPQKYCTRAEAAAILSRFYSVGGTPQITQREKEAN